AARFGYRVTFVDATNLEALRNAVTTETALVYIETPGNPTWAISDIAAIAAIAHGAGAALAVDSTVATPIFTQPLRLGADIAMHSATKYLNGHSDVIAGALATARASGVWEQVKAVRARHGAILGPFEAWLLQRGLRTLATRVTTQAQSAITLAGDLLGHSHVADVLYPGLPHHPGHAVAARQMSGFG